MLDGGFDVGIPTPVREGVGGDVEDPHHDRVISTADFDAVELGVRRLSRHQKRVRVTLRSNTCTIDRDSFSCTHSPCVTFQTLVAKKYEPYSSELGIMKEPKRADEHGSEPKRLTRRGGL